jgi:hypothetical protein
MPRAMPKARYSGANTNGPVKGSSTAMRVTRRMHDEQGFRDLCAQSSPLRCRR